MLRHAHLCASHPWNVIVILTFLTIIFWKLSAGTTQVVNSKICGYEGSEEIKGAEIVLSVAKCVAILYCLHQFLKLNKLGSTFLVITGVLYAVFCLVPCFLFSVDIACLFQGDFSELKMSLPFFFLLMDITKASLLAKFALNSSNQAEVQENIAQGISKLGSSITLDTVVKTLVIGLGTLSGIRELEELCRFACISAVINYIVFMIIFPSSLSLILEIARDIDEGTLVWHLSTLIRISPREEEQKPNPVVEQVKIIMCPCLVLVHVHSRWPLLVANKVLQQANRVNYSDHFIESNWDVLMWFGSAKNLVLIVICTFVGVYHYLQTQNDLKEHLASAALPSRNTIGYESTYSSETAQITPYEGSFWNESNNILTAKPCSPIACNTGVYSACYTLDVDEIVKKLFTSNRSIWPEEVDIIAPAEIQNRKLRTLEEYKKVLQSEAGRASLSDEEILHLAEKGVVRSYKFETIVQDTKRAVVLRRKLLSKLIKHIHALESLPYCHYDYGLVLGSCCENVIGNVPIPVGFAGPLLLDGESLFVPMATTEGCLVASTNRGCRALALSGGVTSICFDDGMTRAPLVKLPSIVEAYKLKKWLNKTENFKILKAAFDSTSRFASLVHIQVTLVDRKVLLRFRATTGDAMGMNMLSKGCEKALNKLKELFPNVEIVSLSSNYCTDKKSSALNWIEGRGKGVACEARIPAKVLKEVLKTDVETLPNLNCCKNHVGSIMAGSIGGFNAQAANIVTAIYLATGQDPAQNVTSSYCITTMEVSGPDKKDLYIACTMPCIEVGTVGGGTSLPAQASCLEMLGVKGPHIEKPSSNASKLARIVCATVLAGELSLLSALAEGSLVSSHMKYNRSSVKVQSPTTAPAS